MRHESSGRNRAAARGDEQARTDGFGALSVADFPTFPPGFWRRIRIVPGVSASGQRWIGGALEDDMHCFHMRMEHDGTRIMALAARALRHPWSACSASPAHLAERLSGRALAELAAEDPAQHCTHLHDLAILLAAHADDRAETRFDMTVADRVEGRTTATISVDGAAALAWPLEGLVIAGGMAGEGPMAGRDLRNAVIFECVGVPGMLQSVIENAPPTAHVVVVGACVEDDRILPVIAINKQLRFDFVFAYTPVEFAETLSAIAEGEIDAARLISGTVALPDASAAFDRLAQPGGDVKLIVQPNA